MYGGSLSEPKDKLTISPTGALRENKGKPQFHQMPYEAVEATVTVLHRCSVEGGGRYPKSNWRKGAPLSVPLDSALRHIFKRLGGEKYDDETGLPHLWHALTNLVFAVYYEKHYPQLDDLKDVTPAPEAAPGTISVAPTSGVTPESLGIKKPGMNLGSLLGPLLMGLAQAQQTPTPEPMGEDSEKIDPQTGLPQTAWRPSGAAGETD
jgi:hypothetical protein